MIKLQQFQTYFWCKKHDWYTNYEINDYLASIYTMPYIQNEYRLIPSNNVKDLTLWIRTIKNDSSYYFRNVESLTFTSSLDDRSDEDNLQIHIKHLNMIVNSQSIKHLRIHDECHVSSSLLLEILNKLPELSSLTINKWALTIFLNDHQLCESLNKKITKLDISSNSRNTYIKSNNTDSYCSESSNLEQLPCNMKHLKCPKLSTINLGTVSYEIYLWVQRNASTLNVHLDFTLIDDENDLAICKTSEVDLVIDLFFC
ncbi:unnamed protein product [Rotaria magnacalcarata]|uniref:Uncharacterized protein n=1 Tax=Rotaria magnacalcarata TaxID=392030 RepID=A0A816FGR5_9BILA|nr:unnamed protein product [Rotaria magnacalcarata]CAF1661315.1 unnamed protein product [Rotaria magnacalcarata]CAF2107349.1 unnamed protein product [Rotaria magnacalcarata]CAF4027877.1 unnamed protein product [Rotaria magnacalcarata]CAF4079811.1 unnamed protein product [Rotaria magnacalcarata]